MMEIRLIKFNTVSSINKFINQHEIALNKLKHTVPNGMNTEELNQIHKMESDLKYLTEKRDAMLAEAKIKPPEFKLFYGSFHHIGHCQITYHSWNEYGELLVYCLQDNGKNFGGIRLLRCSRDGEPSWPVKRISVPFKMEIPQITEYDSNYAIQLKAMCKEWILKNQNGFEVNNG